MSFESLIINIFNHPCKELDVGQRMGYTSYIDYIEQKELPENENVVKGMDCKMRPFIVFKATIIYKNKTKKKTFSTLFQRYSNDKNIWHICGHDGSLIFDTSGGIREDQLVFIDELLEKGSVQIDESNIDIFHNHNQTNNPIQIVLG